MSRQPERAIGVDVGATTTRAAVVDPDGRVIASRRTPTPQGVDALMNWMIGAIREMGGGEIDPEGRFLRIGIALPGVLNHSRDRLIRCVNLPGLEGRDIVGAIQRATGAAAILCTDAEAATWAEYVSLDSPAEAFGHLRIGTGIACGLVRNGALVPTDSNRRTHWDPLVVDRSAEAPPCPCGLRGCLELFASGRALDAKARGIGITGGAAGLQAARESGRVEAVEIVRAAARAVVAAIANLADAFGIELVSIGGGVVDRLPTLITMTAKACQDSAFTAPPPGLRMTSPRCDVRVRSARPDVRATTERCDIQAKLPRCGIRVIAARLGDDAGVIGAARLARP